MDKAYREEVEELIRKLMKGYECGAGPFCETCDWDGWNGGCRMEDAVEELGIRTWKRKKGDATKRRHLTAHPKPKCN